MSTTDDNELVDEVVAEFLVEAHEGLDQLDQDLVTLEDDPTTEVIASIFRTVHTIKGTCGFLGFEHLESVSHVAENLLSKLREGELAVTGDITTALLATVDAIRTMLGAIEASGTDGTDAHADLIAELTALLDGDPPAPPPRLGDLLVEQALVTPEDIELAISQQSLGDTRPLGEILVDHGVVAADEVQDALSSQAARRGNMTDATIRVDVGLLDDLMNLVGELVLARNQIVQLTSDGDHESFAASAQRLNLITTELQEGVMRTRMQPIGNVWNRFPRVVRDLARSVGKQVQIEMDGADTELDKTIVEAIKDPLTHLVRNSIDHGIEVPDLRQAAGKAPEGRLSLRAFHEGGQVIIEIADDGAGVDADRIRRKAVERGLVSSAQVANMSDREAVNLIFLAGLSTAAEVTNVSGRGVGMDVVKTNIERIGGVLDVHTEVGAGTTFRIKIPLTLAIIPALMIECRGNQFAIPQVNLDELVRIERDRVAEAVEWIHGAPVHRLRGRLLPLVDLAGLLELGDTDLVDRPAVNLVVLQADGHRFGLIVDEITDTQEIVVKPLGGQVKDVPAFAGATILGDGRVALILDVLGVAQRAHVVSAARDASVADVVDDLDTTAADLDTLLVVDLGDDHRGAVALSTVARLEQIDRSSIEASSRGPVVQYRGELLPLVSLSAVAGFGAGTQISSSERGAMDVVVWNGEFGQVGLVVDRIVDIVDERIALSGDTGAAGVAGAETVVVAGQVTDLIDVAALLALPDRPNAHHTGALAPSNR
jgi:two-component system, chemotaxis family, sensor kinase CheA